MDQMQTFDCRTSDCDGTSIIARGRYARLCPKCIADGRVDYRPAVRPASEIGKTSYEAKARALVPRGKALDRVVKKVASHKAAGEAIQAKHRLKGQAITTELRKTIEAWNAALLELRMETS